MISRRRGQPSHPRIALHQRERYMELVGEHYADFGPQLAHEYLCRDHGFAWSVETLRGWMIQVGLWRAKRCRAQRVHPSRARRPCLGELVQIDGSHHDLFEGRSNQCCLIAFIDDATWRVLGARIFEQETTYGYLAVLHALMQRHGAPLALYSDRHCIFTKADPEDPKPTQLERALLQLQIEPICAHTPQAKGRVERLFQTLQDRVYKAMRLQCIDTIEQANSCLREYLGEHNRSFAVQARQPQDMHRPWVGHHAGPGRHLLAAPPASTQRARRVQVCGLYPAVAARAAARAKGASDGGHRATRRRHAALELSRPVTHIAQRYRARAFAYGPEG